jgi:Holliday junction DNA helicase RuvA
MADSSMIASIHGRLEAHGADWVVVDVGGVSLRVFVPATAISRLPALGEPVRFLTHLYLREDVIALYGFLSADDLALFEQLIGVTGVGPKVAMTMLSAAPTASLHQAIASENVDNLTKIPGIGKKLAARLILELRGKLTAPAGGVAAPITTAESDVVDALLGLGYSLVDAQSALRSLPTDRALELEDRIRLALQSFARH